MKNYISISKVKAKIIRRMTTGQDELDWLYGVSEFSDGKVWGMPVGTISTWVGEGGVGKSRLAINVAKDKVKDGKTVLYFQNEVDLPTLASWVDDKNLDNFFCSDKTALSEQVSIVKELRPDLVFVDSINLIDEFGTGTAKSIKTIIDGLRKAIRGTECHVIILCQLNKEGSATGSTALTHLPDVNINLTKTDEDDTFNLGIGKKNRYGRTGSTYHGLWRHIETGVECISENRFADDRWIKPDGYKIGLDMTSIIPHCSDPLPVFEPTLVENEPVTLDNCSDLVREAYHELHTDDRPNFLKNCLKFAKKRWGIE